MYLEIIKTVLKQEMYIDEPDITNETIFKEDLELDSLDMVEFTMAVEEVLEVELLDEDIAQIKTVSDLIEAIKKNKG
mgnify:CR=1 FL=1